MIPYFLCLFLIFLGWAAVKRYQASKKEKELREAFWEKEDEANATRRRDISSLPYIHIPTDTLPFHISSSPEVTEQEDILLHLSQQQILNLTGISNTDLKLMYGAPNLPILVECDENFTTMCQALHQWGTLLYKEQYVKEARSVFEFATGVGSDVSGSYICLSQIYQELNLPHLIPNLIQQAEQLNSLSKNTIILKLSEFVHSKI